MIMGPLTLLLLLGAAAGSSTPVLRPHPGFHPVEYLVLRVTLGLGIISLLTLAAGALGAFHSAWFWALSLSGNFLLWRSRGDFSVHWPRRWRFHWLWIPLGVLFLINLFYSLFPPTFHDSMVYHLAVPARYIQHGGLVPWPQNFNASLPLPIEMLYTSLLLGDGLHAPRLLSLAAGIGLLCLLFHWPRQSTARGVRLLPLVLIYSIPQFGFLTSSSKTDPMGMLFLFSGTVLLRQFMTPPHKNALILAAGFAFGSAMAAKYTLLFPVLCLLAGAWILAPPIRRKLKGWMLCALAAFLCLAPWWTKNMVFRGNPFYPYLNGIFHAPGWSEKQAAEFSAVIRRGQDNHPLRLLTFPLAIFLRPYHYGMTAVMGILFLLFIPGILRRSRDINERLLLFAGLSGFVILLFFARAPRYFLPSLLLLSIPLARGTKRLIARKNIFQQAAPLVLAGCLGLNLVLQVHLQEHSFLSATHLIHCLKSRETSPYLDNLPYYRAARFAAEKLPIDRKVAFVGEDRSFYFSGDTLVSSVHDRNIVIDSMRKSFTETGFRYRLREQQITHVLYCPEGLRSMGRKSVTHRLSRGETERLEDYLSRMRVLYLDSSYRLVSVPAPSGLSGGSSRREKPRSRAAIPRI